MITLQTKVHVDGISGMPIFDFLLNPNDDAYQQWWQGTHFEFHPIKQRPGHIGDVVYMDEYVGKRRLRFSGVVIEALPGRKITWQIKQGVRLPVWLVIELEDDANGVMLTHTIKAGFNGIASVLDFIFRLYFSSQFVAAMDEHARTEFPLLGRLLLSAGVLR